MGIRGSLNVRGWCLADFFVANSTLEAEFLAVGHGLAVFLRLPDGHTLLYDCGRLGDPTVGRRIITPHSGPVGVGRIDTVSSATPIKTVTEDGLPDLLDRFEGSATYAFRPVSPGRKIPWRRGLSERLRQRALPVHPLTAPEVDRDRPACTLRFCTRATVGTRRHRTTRTGLRARHQLPPAPSPLDR